MARIKVGMKVHSPIGVGLTPVTVTAVGQAWFLAVGDNGLEDSYWKENFTEVVEPVRTVTFIVEHRCPKEGEVFVAVNNNPGHPMVAVSNIYDERDVLVRITDKDTN